jgi:hypothetical protein
MGRANRHIVAAKMSANKPHRWRFFRAGGFDQVRLDTGLDLGALEQLDPKLWVALSCPTSGLEFDPHTLALLDSDGDGRIRVPEVLAAAAWATSQLKDKDALAKGAATLDLAAIDGSTEEGARILAAAKSVLQNLGRPDGKQIAPADVADPKLLFAGTLFNGDGVVPAEAAGDEPTRQAIRDAIACLGAEKDAGGLDGITLTKLDAFFQQIADHLAWLAKADADPTMRPRGAATTAAYEAWRAVRARVDDYFTRVALAAMDGRAALLNPPDAELLALAGAASELSSASAVKLPLARIEPGRALPLSAGVNPAWAAALRRLKTDAVEPLLGPRESLSAEDWTALCALLTAHDAWQAAKPAGQVEKLGVARLSELSSSGAKAAIAALIAKDKAREPEMKAIAALDKLVHFHRDLGTFLNNFVSFRDFYDRASKKAIFQAGTLYVDGRSCELCLRVSDPGKHATLAAQSLTYLAYCECTRKDGDPAKMSIVAAITGGDVGQLAVGRNGVFYDRRGRDWDATIVKLVEQPISIRQAFWAPYRRAAKIVDEQFERFAGGLDKMEPLSQPGAAPAADASKPPFDVAKFAGIFAAIGLALGALGTAAAAVFTGLLSLEWWQLPPVVIGALLAFSGPSMLLAANKLRRRNLGPLLDASGWAINAQAMINIPFGGSLTRIAALPSGAERSLIDPYAQRRFPFGLVLVGLLLLAGLGWAAWHFHLGGLG